MCFVTHATSENKSIIYTLNLSIMDHRLHFEIHYLHCRPKHSRFHIFEMIYVLCQEKLHPGLFDLFQN
jgi:hypothetical protein